MKRLAALLALLTALDARARPKKPRHAPTEPELLAGGRRSTGPGQVTYLSADSVYLDRGAADGLKPGDKVQMVRSGRALGACVLTSVSDHTATCQGQGFVVGDRISVDRKPEPQPQPLAPLPSGAELAARLWAVEAAPVPLVDFEGGAALGPASASTLSIVLGHTTASNFASADGPYQVQRLDVALRDLHLWRGLHVSVDATGLNWSRRPPDFRQPLKGSPQLFVRQLEVSWHEAGGRYRGALGRIWTRHTPGLSVIDGAQGGITSDDGDLEAGAFGGLLPNPYDLGFSNGSWTAGAYAFGRFSRGRGADAIWVQPELRAGWASRNGIGGRFEVGASLHTWFGRNVDAHAMVQAGLGAVNALDLARLDVGIRAADRFQLVATARYRGTPGGELLEPGALVLGVRALHADAQAVVELGPSLVVAAIGGYSRDFDSRLDSGRIGPELRLPGLLFGKGGLAVGYSEELGWIRGRTAWLQATLVPHWRVRLLARAIGHHYDAPSNGLIGSEVGATASLEVRFTTFLWLRLSGLVRARVDGTGAAGQGGAQLGVEL